MARTVAQEIRAARKGTGAFITEELPWPTFPEGGGRVVLTAAADGRLLGRVEESVYEPGVRDGSAVYVVSVRGADAGLEGGPAGGDVTRMEISVETPAVAAAEKRRKFVYVELVHRDD